MYSIQYTKDTGRRVLRRSDGPNLSKSLSLRLCVTIRFLIMRTSTDKSTIVAFPSVDYRASFVDSWRAR